MFVTHRRLEIGLVLLVVGWALFEFLRRPDDAGWSDLVWLAGFGFAVMAFGISRTTSVARALALWTLAYFAWLGALLWESHDSIEFVFALMFLPVFVAAWAIGWWLIAIGASAGRCTAGLARTGDALEAVVDRLAAGLDDPRLARPIAARCDEDRLGDVFGS